MAKKVKQDRRAASTSGSRRPEEQTQPPSSERRSIIIFLVFFIVLPAISVLVYRIKFSPDTTHDHVDSYPHPSGLVKTDVTYQEILSENSRVSENSSVRNFGNPVLAYITPWNSKGYEIAKRFTSKFTHLSPVWYELKSQGDSLFLDGRHNADLGWISELRKNGDTKVLPRVVLEALPQEILRKKKQKNKAIQLIVSECKEMGFDGIVLESWSRWAAYGVLFDADMRNLALQFIRELGHALHSENLGRNAGQHLELVYVIGPPRSEKLEAYDFGPADLKSLGDAVDGFSLMTYDFSGPQNPGPNAPLKWIRYVLKLLLGSAGNSAQKLSSKIFLGINFYGNDFILPKGGEAITGPGYLTLLDKHKPVLQWEKSSEEHFLVYSDGEQLNHAVFYPSLMSIFLRLNEARKWGTGISIWEIGQGLDYFYDLL